MFQHKTTIVHFMVPAIILSSFCLPAIADVSTDGSLGAAIDYGGPDFVIPESDGAITGGNLFHSFSQFNLTSAQSATFTGNAGIDNVIGRITGGAMSSIDGAVTNAIPGASLYLFNPDGMVFGENAVINVDGSFYAGTADYLVLGDNAGRFDATNIGNTVLSSAPPSAFGFLAGSPANLAVHGTSFNLADGATLGLVAGNVLISGAADPVFNPDGTDDYRIILTDGSLHLAAIDQAAEYGIDAAVGMAAIDSWGDVAIREAGFTAHGDDYGTVHIRAGRLTLSDSFIDAVNEGNTDHDAPAIDIVAGDQFDIEYTGTPNFRALLTDATGSGSPGDIRITTGMLNIQGNVDAATGGGGRVLIHSVTQASALGGDIEINARQINLLDNASIQAEAVGTGDAGDIRISAGQLSVSSTSLAPAFISANAFNSVGASGGDIDIQADSIELLRGGNGFVGITAQGRAATTADRADGGNIQIATGSLRLTGGAQMTTSVFRGTGNAGNIDIQANSVEVAGFSPGGISSVIGSTSEGGGNTSGSAGMVTVTADTIHLHDHGQITTFANTFGNAGDISLAVDSLRVESGAVVTSRNIGAGSAGNIGIDAESILLNSNHTVGLFGTGIFALSGVVGAGAGDIDINATVLEILNGAQINSNTNGAGSGGVINIDTSELLVAGSNNITGENSQISSRTLPYQDFIDFATGNAGTININSDTISVTDGGLITSESSSAGSGGNINVTAGQLTLQNSGGISASATAMGDAGQINIDVNGMTADAGLIAASALLSAGGDMTIHADTLELNNGTVVSSTTASDFSGGNITIDAGQVFLNDSSRIAASSTGAGDSGNIRLDAGSIALNDSSLEATGNAAGDAGSITIEAGGALTADAGLIATSSLLSQGGDISIHADILELNNGTTVTSTTAGDFNGGNIAIDADQARINSRSRIAASSTGDGDSGNIQINADTIALNDASLEATGSAGGDAGSIAIDAAGLLTADAGLIATSALRSAGGDISIRAETLEFDNGTTVTSTTAGDFNGGDIAIDADQVRINSRSRIAASSTGDGDSGNIQINAGSIALNDASLEATGSGSGFAGNINLTADDAIDLFNSRIFTEAALSDGGNITLTATERVYLQDSVISSSVSDGFGNGGNIDIDPVFVILDNSSIIADANGGNGGNIFIRADHFIASPDSILSASSTLGVNGNIVIETPGNNLAETLDKLPQKAVDASALISSQCGEIGKGSSSFVVRKNTAVPVNYLAPIGSRYGRDSNTARMELTLDTGNKNPARQCG